MKLFLINCRSPIVDAFIALGHDVQSVRVDDPHYDIQAALSDLEFIPDVLIQQENLGKRIFISGLSRLSCLKLFWSVDTHLNIYWQIIYARLFDAVLTTQKKYIPDFERRGIAAYWVPWMGIRPGEFSQLNGIKSYQSRSHDMTFVGRISEFRQSRNWFIKFLSSNYYLNSLNGVSYVKMLQVYRDTRIAPNEAILNEVNFRLFEAASCACTVVTPDVGSELEELFDPGREIEVYGNVLELKDILDRLTRDRKAAERMALRGYARVLEDHLPENRARSILEAVSVTDKKSISRNDEFRITGLLHAELIEAGNALFSVGEICERLFPLRGDPEVDAALVRLYALDGDHERVRDLATVYLNGPAEIGDVYFNMSFSLSCWRCGFWDFAKFFWYNYSGKRSQETTIKPENETELLILWAKELSKGGWIIRSGVIFDENKDIPACAVDCLSIAFYLSPTNLEVSKLMELYLDKVGGRQPLRVGFLSHLSLYLPKDWRIAFELAAASFETFRLNQGLAEFKHAQELARSCGQYKSFERLMSHRKLSLSGYLK